MKPGGKFVDMRKRLFFLENFQTRQRRRTSQRIGGIGMPVIKCLVFVEIRIKRSINFSVVKVAAREEDTPICDSFRIDRMNRI